MTLSSLIAIITLLHPILGYCLLRFKGYGKWWNLLLLISLTPLFWLITGCMTSKNKDENTSWASVISVVWAVILLGLIVRNTNMR